MESVSTFGLCLFDAAHAGILTEEVLGYEVGWYKGSTSISSPGLLSGCPGYVMGQPLEGCSEADRVPPKSMINLEYWSYPANKPDYGTADRQKLIRSAGSNGFLGRNGLFVDSGLVQKAWDQADEVADHYRGWQKQYTVSTTKPIGQNETWNRWSAEQCPPEPGSDCTAEGAILSPACNSVECGTLLAYYSNYVPGIIPQMVKNLELHVGVQWLGDDYEVRDGPGIPFVPLHIPSTPVQLLPAATMFKASHWHTSYLHACLPHCAPCALCC